MRKKITTRLGAAATGLIALALVACDPAVKATPVPDRVVWAGDSISVQASVYNDVPTDDTWDSSDNMMGNGWQAEHSHPGVTRAVADPARSPDVLVVALGHNDVAHDYGRDGFTQEDRNQLFALYFAAHEDACAVIVLPHYAGTNSTHLANIEEYRDWVTDVIVPSTPGYFVTVDWRTVVQEHPEYIAPDGVHLDTSNTSANAYVELIESGVRTCEGR